MASATCHTITAIRWSRNSPSLATASAQLFRCHPPIYNEGKTMARVVASGVLLEVTCDEKAIP
jgi:hypothetical protein